MMAAVYFSVVPGVYFSFVTAVVFSGVLKTTTSMPWELSVLDGSRVLWLARLGAQAPVFGWRRILALAGCC